MMNSDTKEAYRRASIEANALGDELVFFDDRVGKYFAVSSGGAAIWEMLASPMNFFDIVVALMDQYEVDEATCRAETKVFIDQMLAAGLLEVC
jgi:hypothetical protein